MGKEMIISASRHETRVAVMEDEQLTEIYFERANEYSLAGSIHKGKVTRVLPGMQSAFVDIGLERDAFLYVSDFFEDHEEFDEFEPGSDKAEKMEKPDRPPKPDRREEARKVAAPAPPPAAETEEPSLGDSGRGDSRRGRSRRRRGRDGRSIPESKYAQASDADEPPTPPAGEPEIEAEPETEVREMIVLPGESLAKYRGAKPPASPVAPQAAGESGEEDGDEAPHETSDEAAASEDSGRRGRRRGSRRRRRRNSPAEAAISTDAASALDPSDQLQADDSEDDVDGASDSGEESDAKIGLASRNAPVIDWDEDEGEPADVVEQPLFFEPAPDVFDEDFDGEDEEDDQDEPVFGGIDDDDPFSASDETEDDDTDDEDDVFDRARFGDEPDEDALGQEDDEPVRASGERPAAADDDDMPPVRIPLSLTATLRERGGRYLQRRSNQPSRRRRGRRGRGRQEGGIDDQDQVGQETAGPATESHLTEVVPPQDTREERPERSQRSQSRGRNRDSNREERDLKQSPDKAREQQPAKERENYRERERNRPQIGDLLKTGQEVLVQIAKEPIAQKGARITSHIALPGRFVVYMPTVEHLGVSRKIGSDAERARLRKILQTHQKGMTGGFIIRTAGTGKSEHEIAADMNFLYNQWLDIRTKAEKSKAPSLIYHDLNVVERVMRDQLDSTFKNIWVDNDEVYEATIRFVQRFQPTLVDRVRLYTRREPAFEALGVAQELEKALKPKVWLKSGGYIVINQTEALVAIDVNTGKYVGRSDRLEDTITKTNTEAVKEIARQMKLRDLGGIIVIDFIDMDERRNRTRVMQALEEAMRTDRAPYKILQFNDFGLVAITRKRVKQSLERAMCSPCPYCTGAGYVKSVETVISEILLEAQKVAPTLEAKDVVLRVNSEVATVLKSHRNRHLEELEEIFNRTVIIKSDAALHRELYDIA